MINKLSPAEILSSILPSLSLGDKFRCMLVCKYWYDTIINLDLFKKVEFKKNQEKFDRALDFFKENLYLGHQQVRHLDVEELKHIDTETVIALTTIFPNITSLEWIEKNYRASEHYNQFKFISESYKEALKQWKHLQRIVDYPTHIFLHISTSLLYTCTMINLKYLEVLFEDYISMRVGREIHGRNMLVELIKYIHNAPSRCNGTANSTCNFITVSPGHQDARDYLQNNNSHLFQPRPYPIFKHVKTLDSFNYQTQ
jgi:hypothetical protein